MAGFEMPCTLRVNWAEPGWSVFSKLVTFSSLLLMEQVGAGFTSALSELSEQVRTPLGMLYCCGNIMCTWSLVRYVTPGFLSIVNVY